MSDNKYLPSVATVRSSLPVFTALFGVMGLASGTFGLVNPAEGSRALGLPLDSRKTPSALQSQGWQKSYLQLSSLRNMAGGITNLCLAAYWRFSPLCKSSPVAAKAVRQVIGIAFICGSIVAAGDGYIIAEAAKDEDASEEAKEVAVKTYKGHVFMALPILALGLTCYLI